MQTLITLYSTVYYNSVREEEKNAFAVSYANECCEHCRSKFAPQYRTKLSFSSAISMARQSSRLFLGLPYSVATAIRCSRRTLDWILFTHRKVLWIRSTVHTIPTSSPYCWQWPLFLFVSTFINIIPDKHILRCFGMFCSYQWRNVFLWRRPL